jgi:hypothetical protein
MEPPHTPRVSRHAILQIGCEEFERVRRDGAATLSLFFTPGTRWKDMFQCAMAAVQFGDAGTIGQTVIVDLYRQPDLSDDEIIEKAREAREPL